MTSLPCVAGAGRWTVGCEDGRICARRGEHSGALQGLEASTGLDRPRQASTGLDPNSGRSVAEWDPSLKRATDACVLASNNASPAQSRRGAPGGMLNRPTPRRLRRS
ncbi:hypothetical protein EMIHUDRAFT_245554 [Emiliania huxleyi CCMP1516]|uniref:Uncharacterized protein n=2 Tax=Emiliania huxleyi TaxID=2903 RepID=A0A0D3IX50_EMIH1|nr:hypothetical protein EMIHUDRAFT_245554 [Emiliania huxleyi CCMP1516]EOD15835.1 hypothetical protein EMIHUDRAFT_245554 [Emiliania huxleyi CCMP1516]|eukprot:XP_005768264.1 hypothetical protein EMIHUDRAFT_245554 [Emiliania huxleyi CCMP1516]